MISSTVQPARQASASPARLELRFLHFLKRNAGALVESHPGVGGRKRVGRARQQSYLQPVFELRDRLRHGGLTDAELPGGAGKRAGLDHAHEGDHRMKPIHHSSRE